MKPVVEIRRVETNFDYRFEICVDDRMLVAGYSPISLTVLEATIFKVAESLGADVQFSCVTEKADSDSHEQLSLDI